MAEKANTYVAYVDASSKVEKVLEEFLAIELTAGLLLIYSDQTQSQVYHAIKRLAEPTTLFVGKLSKNPKFKGMAEGSLKWVRSQA